MEDDLEVYMSRNCILFDNNVCVYVWDWGVVNIMVNFLEVIWYLGKFSSNYLLINFKFGL